jgi:transcriptional regulator with XRE-family HTH domain
MSAHAHLGVEETSLAALLRQRMDELRLSTHAELAQRLGVGQPTATKWLNGAPPGDENLEVIADFLDVTPDELVPLVLRARQQRRDVLTPLRPGRPPQETSRILVRDFLDRLGEALERADFRLVGHQSMATRSEQGWFALRYADGTRRTIRPDLVAQRNDGEVFVIEVVDNSSVKSTTNRLVSSLGQVLHYAAALEEAHYGDPVHPVVALIEPLTDHTMAGAFLRAGVNLLDVPPEAVARELQRDTRAFEGLRNNVIHGLARAAHEAEELPVAGLTPRRMMRPTGVPEEPEGP